MHGYLTPHFCESLCESVDIYLFCNCVRWVGLVGQFRPRKLISSIKKQVANGDELRLPSFKNVAKHFLDKSLYALGLFSQLSLTDDTSLLFNMERHYHKSARRLKAVLFHRVNC